MQPVLQKLDDHLIQEFKIEISSHEDFNYYCFFSQYSESWDIFGIFFAPDGNVVVRLMHIDEEMFEDENFSATKDSGSFILLNLFECQQFLDFIKNLLPEEAQIQTQTSYFELLDTQQLQKFHYSKSLVASRKGSWYQYSENKNAKDDPINLIGTPHYSKKYGSNQISALWFIALDSSHIADEHFDLILNSYGLGTIAFSREALANLIDLLNEEIDQRL